MLELNRDIYLDTHFNFNNFFFKVWVLCKKKKMIMLKCLLIKNIFGAGVLSLIFEELLWQEVVIFWCPPTCAPQHSSSPPQEQYKYYKNNTLQLLLVVAPMSNSSYTHEAEAQRQEGCKGTEVKPSHSDKGVLDPCRFSNKQNSFS